jgi:gliding motility-associated-like protein
MCSNTDSVKVEIASDNNFILNSDYKLCYGDSIELKATGGKKYSWTPNASLTGPDVSNPIVFPQTTSTYSVLVTDNCNNSATLSTTVTVLPAPTIQVVKSNDVDCNIPRSQLQAMGAKKYIWSPAVNITDATISNPIVYPHANTWYTVIGTDENGCHASDSVLVSSSISAGGSSLYIPNAFTPNADLKNDCFGMKHFGEVDFFKLSIYNRWGQLLFQTNNVNNCWDGTFQGRQQPAGVYIYLLSIKSICIPQLVKKEGVVTLIR